MIQAELYRGLQDQRRFDRWIVPACFGVLALLMMVSMFVLPCLDGSRSLEKIGGEFLSFYYGMTLGLAALYATFRAGDAISRETRERTFDLLRITGMPLSRILWGKLLAALIAPALCLLVSIPFAVLPILGVPGALSFALEFYLVLVPATLLMFAASGLLAGCLSPRGESGGGQAGILVFLLHYALVAIAMESHSPRDGGPVAPLAGALSPLAPLVHFGRNGKAPMVDLFGLPLPMVLASALIALVVTLILFRIAVRQLREPVPAPFPMAIYTATVALIATVHWSWSPAVRDAISYSGKAWHDMMGLTLAFFLSTVAIAGLPSRETLKEAVLQGRPCGLFPVGRRPILTMLLPFLTAYGLLVGPRLLVDGGLSAATATSVLGGFVLSMTYLTIAQVYRLYVELKVSHLAILVAVFFSGLAVVDLLKLEVTHVLLASPWVLTFAHERPSWLFASVVYGVLLTVGGHLLIRRQILVYEARRDRLFSAPRRAAP